MTKSQFFLCSLAIGLSAVILNFSFATIVSADFESDTGLGETGQGAGYTKINQMDHTSPAVIIGSVIKILLSFIGVVFLGLMIYGGYTWMMARGNQAEVDKAQKMIESAIIGLIIVLAAYAITYFVGLALNQVEITK